MHKVVEFVCRVIVEEVDHREHCDSRTEGRVPLLLFILRQERDDLALRPDLRRTPP